MSRRLDSAIAQRIIQLHFEQGLPASIITIRLGISERTVWNYIKSYRDQGCTTPASVDDVLIAS